MLQQLRDPLTVFGIGLASRDRFNVMWIDQHQLELALQNGPHWTPIHPGRLHHYVRHRVLSQPIR